MLESLVVSEMCISVSAAVLRGRRADGRSRRLVAQLAVVVARPAVACVLLHGGRVRLLRRRLLRLVVLLLPRLSPKLQHRRPHLTSVTGDHTVVGC